MLCGLCQSSRRVFENYKDVKCFGLRGFKLEVLGVEAFPLRGAEYVV